LAYNQELYDHFHTRNIINEYAYHIGEKKYKPRPQYLQQPTCGTDIPQHGLAHSSRKFQCWMEASRLQYVTVSQENWLAVFQGGDIVSQPNLCFRDVSLYIVLSIEPLQGVILSFPSQENT
jgi:hypothetical protein